MGRALLKVHHACAFFQNTVSSRPESSLRCEHVEMGEMIGYCKHFLFGDFFFFFGFWEVTEDSGIRVCGCVCVILERHSMNNAENGTV